MEDAVKVVIKAGGAEIKTKAIKGQAALPKLKAPKD
jgi:hypothetical protein